MNVVYFYVFKLCNDYVVRHTVLGLQKLDHYSSRTLYCFLLEKAFVFIPSRILRT